MNFIVRLSVLFYVSITMFICVLFAFFILQRIPIQFFTDVLYVLYYDPQYRLISGAAIIFVLWLNFIFWRAISGSYQRGRTIAFDNPSGRVSVSLVALEDLTKRVISRVDEVKEVRSSIRAGRKGLEVQARLILNADVNIPEMTSKLQEIVKRRIQGMIGIEEEIEVRVHVVKIIPGAKSKRPAKEQTPDVEKEDQHPNIPFQGYRA